MPRSLQLIYKTLNHQLQRSDEQTYVKIPSRYAETSASMRPHPTGAVAPTRRREYGLVNGIPAGYESDDSWDTGSHTHDHTHTPIT